MPQSCLNQNILFLGVIFCLIASLISCETSQNDLAYSGITIKVSQNEEIKPEAKPKIPVVTMTSVIKFTDQNPLFKKVMLDSRALEKEKFETTEEYNNRLAQYSLEGQSHWFIVDPQFVDSIAYPDENLYIIHCKNDFRYVVLSVSEKITQTIMKSNAFGVTVKVLETYTFQNALRVMNLRDLPLNAFWGTSRFSDMSSELKYIGIAIKPDQASFRNKLKNDQITLAFKCRIAPVLETRFDSQRKEATISSPYFNLITTTELPVYITEIRIVDWTTKLSIAGMKIQISE